MKTIALCGAAGAGLVALVDDEDHEVLSAHRWHALRVKGSLTVYARTTIDGKTVYMHRLVLQPPAHLSVDHIDGNGLNNQRSNLEAVTHQQNVRAVSSRRAYDAWRASR